MKGILADANVVGQVAYLVRLMQEDPWAEYWRSLGLVLYRLEDFGLSATSSDLQIWQCCQTNEVVLITDNRNEDSPDSLAATIHNSITPASLPVFTIGSLRDFAVNQDYVNRVLETLYDYLLRIDEVRGTGRLFLP